MRHRIAAAIAMALLLGGCDDPGAEPEADGSTAPSYRERVAQECLDAGGTFTWEESNEGWGRVTHRCTMEP